jgi:hypothetical protein
LSSAADPNGYFPYSRATLGTGSREKTGGGWSPLGLGKPPVYRPPAQEVPAQLGLDRGWESGMEKQGTAWAGDRHVSPVQPSSPWSLSPVPPPQRDPHSLI